MLGLVVDKIRWLAFNLQCIVLLAGIASSNFFAAVYVLVTCASQSVSQLTFYSLQLQVIDMPNFKYTKGRHLIPVVCLLTRKHVLDFAGFGMWQHIFHTHASACVSVQSVVQSLMDCYKEPHFLSALCGSSSYSCLLTQKDGLSFMMSAKTAPPRKTAYGNISNLLSNSGMLAKVAWHGVPCQCTHH